MPDTADLTFYSAANLSPQSDFNYGSNVYCNGSILHVSLIEEGPAGEADFISACYHKLTVKIVDSFFLMVATSI